MSSYSTNVSISKVLRNQVQDEENYRHLDITVNHISGIVDTDMVRFKLFNFSGKVGFEFRQTSGWPQVFTKWPGHKADEWGELYTIVAGDESTIAPLDVGNRRMIVDLVRGIVDIVEHAAVGLDHSAKYIEDARLLVEKCRPFLERELAAFALENTSKAVQPAPAKDDWSQRLSNIESQLSVLRGEFVAYRNSLNTNVGDLNAIIEETRAFKLQIPQILNAASAANAASRIVGEVKSMLDSEVGVVVKSLNEFRRELDSLWNALDKAGQKQGAESPSPRSSTYK